MSTGYVLTRQSRPDYAKETAAAWRIQAMAGQESRRDALADTDQETRERAEGTRDPLSHDVEAVMNTTQRIVVWVNDGIATVDERTIPSGYTVEVRDYDGMESDYEEDEQQHDEYGKFYTLAEYDKWPL